MLLNQARFSFNRFSSIYTNLNPTHLSDLGGSFPLFGPKIPPNVAITGRVTLGNASSVDAIAVNEGLQVNESLTWTRQRHSIRGGYELLKLRYLNRSFFQTMGSFTLTGRSRQCRGDFVLGRPRNDGCESGSRTGGLQTNHYFFVQDDWRVHPRLTLNLGCVRGAVNWCILPIGGAFRQASSLASLNAPWAWCSGDPGSGGAVRYRRNNFCAANRICLGPLGDGRIAVRGPTASSMTPSIRT
jgi:hypothetical protein